MSLRPKNHSARRGSTTVEFALTAPILFLLVMGAVEFSRANIIRHTTIIAASEAARSSIVPGATTEDCLQKAQSELAIVGINQATIEIDPAEITDDTDQVSVSVEVPLDGSNGFILPGFLTGNRVEKSVTLQRESSGSRPTAENISSSGSAASTGS